ncbi:hypothetical protein EMM73_07620 [Rheinheimera sediminis]|uniref:hypothetical protein n=1 Tax=Rheinheimera sp. YQF-1 TaxID=2499626 RepID=UPI000FD7CBA0|nr:hypothetical protein [Rheinheimera sp. YQF-1]RVT46733.1 hypothetical protein EMM73_07620 [Rheinheimera sp. YQF-1]
MQPVEAHNPDISLASELTEQQKLQARQQCFYGCVFCGSPVFRYYQSPKSPSAVLICALHAKQLHGTFLSPSTLLERISQPFNQQRVNKPGFSFDPERRVQVSVGMNTVYADFLQSGGEQYCIWVNGQELFTLHSESGWLCFSFMLSDNTGETVIRVDKGELQLSPEHWEYSYEVNTLKIRDQQRKLQFTAQLCNDRVLLTKGQFIDNFGDGFVVEGNRVIAMLDGQKGGHYMHRIEPGRYKGGWALFNKIRHPDLVMPGNFAFVCAAKRKSSGTER